MKKLLYSMFLWSLFSGAMDHSKLEKDNAIAQEITYILNLPHHQWSVEPTMQWYKDLFPRVAYSIYKDYKREIKVRMRQGLKQKKLIKPFNNDRLPERLIYNNYKNLIAQLLEYDPSLKHVPDFTQAFFAYARTHKTNIPQWLHKQSMADRVRYIDCSPSHSFFRLGGLIRCTDYLQNNGALSISDRDVDA